MVERREGHVFAKKFGDGAVRQRGARRSGCHSQDASGLMLTGSDSL